MEANGVEEDDWGKGKPSEDNEEEEEEVEEEEDDAPEVEKPKPKDDAMVAPPSTAPRAAAEGEGVFRGFGVPGG